MNTQTDLTVRLLNIRDDFNITPLGPLTAKPSLQIAFDGPLTPEQRAQINTLLEESGISALVQDNMSMAACDI